MIAYRLTALQYGRVILEPSHPTRRLGVVETSVNVYDPAFTSYTEGSALTQPLQHLKKHMPQETIIELSSLIFSKYPGEVVDESYPGGRRQAMDDFTAWMIDDELAGGSMIEHSWTTLQFGPVAVVSTLRSTTTMAAHGNGLYMEWDNKSSELPVEVNMPLDLLRITVEPNQIGTVVQGLLRKERRLLDQDYNGGYMQAVRDFTDWMRR
ncbi:hypothetical protein [Corynebacterium durum]|uniref:Uncharacterized protein n=1 Tax=Corynebacterium durum F0235 TaxID=1035195 RepID=L1MFN8_9CORY|nr:hypothetical protein [Corynebacterium durum]EKX90052.1 hypothetical protein HMPREF9997_01260 [Corynebacterium durum F0235]